ncbi:MAG: hypothetical protein JNK27_15690 [Chitinophagaceae bacterium]|nr:hypothetical protein [Chitinophagaceae bacterium]
MELLSFLKELVTTWDQSTISYKAYLSSGKIFHFAQQLRQYNNKALELLIQHKQLLPDNMQQDATTLINHYNIWTEKWEGLVAELSPAPDDEFVFANSITFPKEAVRNLETLYEELKQR